MPYHSFERCDNTHDLARFSLNKSSFSQIASSIALLEYLMTHTNNALSRTICDSRESWGYHYGALTNVVDVYIRYLRNKVVKAYLKKLIQTVRDMGYKNLG